jgi:hypothetical protein
MSHINSQRVDEILAMQIDREWRRFVGPGNPNAERSRNKQAPRKNADPFGDHFPLAPGISTFG